MKKFTTRWFLIKKICLRFRNLLWCYFSKILIIRSRFSKIIQIFITISISLRGKFIKITIAIIIIFEKTIIVIIIILVVYTLILFTTKHILF